MKNDIRFALQIDDGWFDSDYLASEISFLKERINGDVNLLNSLTLEWYQKAYDDTHLMPIRHSEETIARKKAIIAAIHMHVEFNNHKPYFLFCIHCLNEDIAGIEERNKQRKEHLQHADFDAFCKVQKELIEWSISDAQRRLELLEMTFKTLGSIPLYQADRTTQQLYENCDQMLQQVCDDIISSLIKE